MKPCWDNSVKKALQMIRGSDSDLVKVEGQNAYKFCIQPPNAPAFVGNNAEQLSHRKNLNIASEALAGTQPRGFTNFEDLHIGQDLLFSPKDNIEFTIVRENIQRKLEVC